MKAIKISGGKPCPKCDMPMQRKEHPEGFKPKPGRNWFRYWDHCIPCGHVQHYESARVKA